MLPDVEVCVCCKSHDDGGCWKRTAKRREDVKRNKVLWGGLRLKLSWFNWTGTGLQTNSRKGNGD